MRRIGLISSLGGIKYFQARCLPGLLAALGVIISGFGARAQSMVKYKVEDLGANTTGIAMNAKHQVVGNNNNSDSLAFYYGAAGFQTPAQIQNSPGSFSVSINSGGSWLGGYMDGDYNNHFFVMTGNVFTDITSALPLEDYPAITAISDEGKVIANGMSGVYVYDLNTLKLEMLATNALTMSFNALHINNSGGQIVGSKSVGGPSYACAWSTNKAFTDLAALYLQGKTSLANANNDQGDIVGVWDISSNVKKGFFIDATNGLVVLSPPQGALGSGAIAVSNKKEIVGDYTTVEGEKRACCWTVGGAISDLNDLVAPEAGRVLNTATEVSADGTILCNGLDAMGLPHAYILTPLSTSLPVAPDIQSIQTIGGLLNISYKAVAGKSYQPQYRNSLSNNDMLDVAWQSLGAQQTATNSVMSFTDSPTNATRFYRVELISAQ